MNKSLLLHVSLLMSSVSAFAPATTGVSHCVKSPIGGETSTSFIVEPRNIDNRSSALSAEVGPVVPTLIFLFGVAGAFYLNPDEENAVPMINIGQSLVAEEVPVETESVAPVVNKIEEVKVIEKTTEKVDNSVAAEEQSTSFVSKLAVKLVMPWRKFSTI